MEFKEFRTLFQQHVATILSCVDRLYVTGVDRDVLWNTYLDSFPPGTNEIFRERREFDCSCCRQFIKQFGNIVVIGDDNKLVSLWDFAVHAGKFQSVLNALSTFVKSAPIRDAFVTNQSAFGTDCNFEQLDDGTVHTWHHFRLELPARFVNKTSKSSAALAGELRASRGVFQRSLEEISREAVETVLDLIAEKSLYRGEEWQGVLEKFLGLHDEYHTLPGDQHDNYCWRKSAQVGGAISRIRNHSIGRLLQNLTGSKEMQAYEIVNPSDDYTIQADELGLACVATLLLGKGKYGLMLDGETVMPLFIFSDASNFFAREFDCTLDDLLGRYSPSRIANCLDSIVVGDRVKYETELSTLSESERRDAWEKWHDTHHRSLNDIGRRAKDLACQLREVEQVADQ